MLATRDMNIADLHDTQVLCGRIDKTVGYYRWFSRGTIIVHDAETLLSAWWLIACKECNAYTVLQAYTTQDTNKAN